MICCTGPGLEEGVCLCIVHYFRILNMLYMYVCVYIYMYDYKF